LVQIPVFRPINISLGKSGIAESLSGFGGAAHVVIARMVSAVARTIPKINSRLCGLTSLCG
jgi:hypothetical protein